MRTVIVYESVFGNTREIAEAIAAGVRDRRPGSEVACVPVAIADAGLINGADLLVVGGPTHMRGMSTGMTRQKGAESEQQKFPRLHLEPGFDGPGLREWLDGMKRQDVAGRAAAFDTRVASRLAGSAAKRIALQLRRRGYRVLAREGFVVDGTHGPLRSGETARARQWGASLLASRSTPVS